MKHPLTIISILLILGCKSDRIEQVSMSKFVHDGWEFSKENGENWYPAQVPGVVHLDLLSNGLIDDPFWEDNELKQRWIEEENWVYKTTFSVDRSTLDLDHIELVFHGLDTYADVFVNGTKVLAASNMFRIWNKDVKHLLNEGSNELSIVFESPIARNRNKVKAYPHTLPSGNEAEDISVKVSSFTRKAAYQFGWDWGPRFVTAGIWRPVELFAWSKARIISGYTSTLKLEPDHALMLTETEVEVLEAGSYILQTGDRKVQQWLETGIHVILDTFNVTDPQLWWTNGEGEAHLYRQSIQLIDNGSILDTHSHTYGIRTIELIHQPDSIGTSFYFLLNGKPIFMKGANYIPQDVFLPRVKDHQFRSLIRAVKEANMNMLRVWGGGVYERDLFYHLCDSNGILVWQDFMFANSLYPDDTSFQQNILAEVTDVVKRLRGHPSLTIWCGNNEIEVAWKYWGWQDQYGYTRSDSVEIWQNHLYTFHQLIPDLVKKYHPTGNYTPTSPLSNWGTPANYNHGTMHYWGVWHGREPFEAFEENVGRFMAEYGFQSFPSIQTLNGVIADSNLYLGSPTIDHRQKSYIGNGLILDHIGQYFENPNSFEEFVELSQETQAKGLGMAIDAHIKAQPQCMGSLFWQLNDCWPGPSWSVIDYYGRKKKAYATVKSRFSIN